MQLRGAGVGSSRKRFEVSRTQNAELLTTYKFSVSRAVVSSHHSMAKKHIPDVHIIERRESEVFQRI